MRKTKLRRTARKGTLSWHKKELWKVFSRYIRLRDKGTCFTCGLQRPWKTMQAGHMIPRASGGLSLYFHEKNVHCQCYRCNINLGGNGAVYANNFIERYGQEEFDEIIRLKDQGMVKYNISDYERMKEEYEKKVGDILETYEE